MASKYYKKERIRRKDPRYNQISMFVWNSKRKQEAAAERHKEAFVRKCAPRAEFRPPPPPEDRVAPQEWAAQMAEFDLWKLRKKHRTLVEDEDILESEAAIGAARKVKWIEAERLEWARDVVAKKMEVEELREQVLALRAELREAREENEELKLKVK